MKWKILLLLTIFILSSSYISALTIFNMTVLDTYQDNSASGSIEGGRGIQVDAARKLLFLNSFSDDCVTAINYTNASNLLLWGSICNSGTLGSLDGIYYGTLDPTRKIYYGSASVDDRFSMYNVTGTTFTLLNASPTFASGVNSTDGIWSISYQDIAGTTWAIGSSLLDDYITVYNVTNPWVVALVKSSRTDSAPACSLDGVEGLYSIEGTNYTIAASTIDAELSTYEIQPNGSIFCSYGYTDTSGIGSIRGIENMYYENSTKLMYVVSPVDAYFTILNYTNPKSVTVVGSINGFNVGIISSTVTTVLGTKYAIIGSNDSNQGLWVVNVTNPASPVIVKNYNVTSGSCLYNRVHGLYAEDGILYVQSSIDYCLMAINLTTDLNCTEPTNGMVINTNTTLCSGTYYFNGSMVDDDGTYYSMVIKSSDVTLDCNGATFIGPNGTTSRLLYVRSSDRVTIKNCNIQDYANHIMSSYNRPIYINNNTFSGYSNTNYLYGTIYFDGGDGSRITNSRFNITTGGGRCIDGYEMPNMLIENNTFTSCGTNTIWAAAFQNGVIKNNIFGSSTYNLQGNQLVLNNQTWGSISNNVSIINNSFLGNYTAYNIMELDTVTNSIITDNLFNYSDVFNEYIYAMTFSDSSSTLVCNNTYVTITPTYGTYTDCGVIDYTLQDCSGNSRNISGISLLTYDQRGYYNYSQAGSIAYMPQIAINNLFTTNEATVGAWVYRISNGIGTDYARIFDSQGNEGGIRLMSDVSGGLLCEAANWSTFASSDIMTNNAWHYVACNVNTTGTQIYIDGIASGSSNPRSKALGDDEYGYIGSQQGANRAWDGSIDELTIWNISLTPTEMMQVYQNYSVHPENLVAYYRFNNDDNCTLPSPPISYTVYNISWNGSGWYYNDSDVWVGDNWYNNTNYLNWKYGYSYLGYETAGINTTVQIGTYPYPTYYFVSNFSIADTSKVTSMALNIDYDDGYIIYLNGVIINTSEPSINWTNHSALSTQTHNSMIDSSATAPVFPSTNVTLSALRNGTNILAVAIKQASTTSTDIAFMMNMTMLYYGNNTIIPPSDSCTCPNNANTNWIIQMSDNCKITGDCLVANLTLNGTGTLNYSVGRLNYSNINFSTYNIRIDGFNTFWFKR